MGGGDEPENLIELSIEDHAEEHRKLYEKHGYREDYLAWKGLLGQMKKEDILQELYSLAGKNSAIARRERGDPIGFQHWNPDTLKEMCSRAGSVSKNKNSVWWSNGTDYKFCIEQPEGYTRSTAPNNVGATTKKTFWWNNGKNHRRAKDCPAEGWVKGRINKGNLGGKRT